MYDDMPSERQFQMLSPKNLVFLGVMCSSLAWIEGRMKGALDKRARQVPLSSSENDTPKDDSPPAKIQVFTYPRANL